MRLPAICEKTGLNKGAWTAEEDELLSSYVKTYGHENWGKLPKNAGLNRTGKSCRLRWLNYLRPDLKKGKFMAEEEALVHKLHQQFGNSWSKIAANLPGRSDNEIKNYWHTSRKNHSAAPNKAAPKPKSAPKQEDIDLVVELPKAYDFCTEAVVMKDPVADEMNPEFVPTAWPDLVELEFMLENISSLEKCYGEIGFELNPDNNITPVLDFPEGFFSPFVADGEGQIPNCVPIEETTISAEARSETDGNYWSGEMFLLSQNLDMAFDLDEASLLPPFHPPGEVLYENPYPFYNGYHG